MQPYTTTQPEISEKAREFYTHSLLLLKESKIPFLVAGAYAYERYTGIKRHTKDLDIFAQRKDWNDISKLFERAGYETTDHAHWIGKAYCDGDYVDVIFHSANGFGAVDDSWFQYAVDETVFGIDLKIIPAEEMIWSKSFVMDRDRFDGADITHLIRERGHLLDWDRLLLRYGPHWHVLLSHLILYQFVYPAERDQVPAPVLDLLLKKFNEERSQKPTDERLCRGTLISALQYAIDTEQWGYTDARLSPHGQLTPGQVEHWVESLKTSA